MISLNQCRFSSKSRPGMSKSGLSVTRNTGLNWVSVHFLNTSSGSRFRLLVGSWVHRELAHGSTTTGRTAT